MKWKWLILGLFFLVLIAFGIAVGYFQAQLLVYNPVRQRLAIAETPAQYELSYESITLTTGDDYQLAGWYIPSHNRAAVIALHDYQGNRSDLLPIAAVLAQHGYGVILIDWRAHGESEGERITFGQDEVQDVEAAYHYLLDRPDVDPGRIGALGISMGGAIAILEAAHNPGIKAVVAEATYTSLAEALPTLLQVTSDLPSSFLLAPVIRWFAERETGLDFASARLAPIEQIGSISPRPVFLMQAGMDIMTPLDSGQRLYDAAGEPRELWFEARMVHGLFRLLPAYEERVTAFLDRSLLP